MEKKSALKTALIAARGTNTNFGKIAGFWEEFVLEPEEKELQQQRRQRKVQQQAVRRWNGATKSANLTRAKSCDELVVVGVVGKVGGAGAAGKATAAFDNTGSMLGGSSST